MPAITTHKVACPRCQASLKSPKPIPPGKSLTCPRCKTAFKAGDRPSPAAAASQPSEEAIFELAGEATPRPNVLGRAFAVLGTLCLLGAAAGAAIWYVFAADPSKAREEKKEDAFVIPEPKEPPKARPLIVLEKEEEDAVKAIVAKGMAWLKTQQRPDGSWPTNHGYVEAHTAMAGLVLLEGGTPSSDPAIAKAADYLRKTFDGVHKTYTLTLTILFFDKLKDPADAERLARAALKLAAGQQPQGGWSYDCPAISLPDHATLKSILDDLKTETPEASRKKRAELWKRLHPALLATPALHPLPAVDDKNFFRVGGDNSNTQFALLGLWAARRNGVPVDRCLERVVERFRRSQNPDGSWNYSGTTNASSLPTMTCAGLLGLAVGMGLSEARERDNRDLLAVKKGLAHLSHAIDTPAKGPKAPPPPPTELYFLWSVERVGVLFQQPKINEKDWYRWGLSILKHHQRPQGFWHLGAGHGSSDIIDTCFALLFLERVNLAADLSDKIRAIAPATESAGPPGTKE